MIIGRKGTGIRKIQQEYGVEIKLPREGDPNPDMVIIMGGEEGVLDCKDHLLNIQEEYLQDAIDQELLQEYEKPPSRSAEKSLSKNSNSDGFKVVKGAPWQGASTKPLFQHWVEEAMHRLFLPLPLLGDQSAKYLRQYDFNHVLTDNEIKT